MTDQMNATDRDESTKILIDLVRGIARSLVDDADSVVVDAASDGDGTLLRLRVAPGEVGKVIGKQGRTARSLRTILSAAGMKQKHRFTLDIVEDARNSQEQGQGAVS